MEFRQVIHSVSRTAAAAARPSLASTRPSPAGIVLLQRHRFTTNNKQQLEAAAAVAQPQQAPGPAHTSSSRNRVDKLRASLQNSSSIPPRPPPFRTDNFFEDPQKKKATPTWARPAPKGNSPAAPFGRRTTLTGRAPTAATGNPSPSSSDSMFNLPSQIQSDMQSTTSGNLGTWNDGDFTSKWYGVTEPELRLRPQTGRTVHVQGNVDLARGFRLLQRAVTQNKVRHQVYLARHHERPALKRKRQKRERWQARFKVGFRATIERVMELKAQGW